MADFRTQEMPNTNGETALKNRSNIYFIQGQMSGLIKIGISQDPEARLRQMQSGSPEELSLLKQVKGYHEDEKMLHKRLDDYRVHGEWFEPSRDVHILIDLIEDFPIRAQTPDFILTCPVCGSHRTRMTQYQDSMYREFATTISCESCCEDFVLWLSNTPMGVSVTSHMVDSIGYEQAMRFLDDNTLPDHYEVV